MTDDLRMDARDDMGDWRTPKCPPPCDCGWEFINQSEKDAGCPACRIGVDMRDEAAA